MIKICVPLILFLLGIIFKWNQEKREEVAHALDSAIRRYQEGEIPLSDVKTILLATGHVSERRTDQIIEALRIAGEISDQSVERPIYNHEFIKGVEVKINNGGEITIDPVGLLNTWAHKITKWYKKKVG